MRKAPIILSVLEAWRKTIVLGRKYRGSTKIDGRRTFLLRKKSYLLSLSYSLHNNLDHRRRFPCAWRAVNDRKIVLRQDKSDGIALAIVQVRVDKRQLGALSVKRGKQLAVLQKDVDEMTGWALTVVLQLI